MSKDRKKRGDKDGQTLGDQKSQVFSGKAGMMAIPSSIEAGRKVENVKAEPVKSARATWKSPSSDSSNRAIAKAGQMISLTDTAISAMPSDSRDLTVLYEK